jgi:Protein of unknown function (DUF2630)
LECTTTNIISQINSLAAEQHDLFEKASRREEDDSHGLESLAIELDRLWDLLRQRRARRAAGLAQTKLSTVMRRPSRAT